MEIGKVVRRHRLQIAKTKIKKFDKSKLRKPTKVVFSIFLFFILSIGLVNLQSSLKNSLNNYYLNAQTKIEDPEIIPAEITESTTLTQKNLSNDFNSLSNATYIDKRAYVLDKYLQSNGSPLYGKGQTFVDACDKYGAPHECITVVAIAFNESHLCKYPGSAEMFNCWGFGGAGVYRRTFSSFDEGIDTVTKVLVQQYGLKYMENPQLMENTFCGTEDPLCDSWGRKINYFMNNIRQFSKDLGVDMNS
jgi:hypothetical protein